MDLNLFTMAVYSFCVVRQSVRQTEGKLELTFVIGRLFDRD